MSGGGGGAGQSETAVQGHRVHTGPRLPPALWLCQPLSQPGALKRFSQEPGEDAEVLDP